MVIFKDILRCIVKNPRFPHEADFVLNFPELLILVCGSNQQKLIHGFNTCTPFG